MTTTAPLRGMPHAWPRHRALLALLVALVVLASGAVSGARTRTVRLGFLGSTNLPNANTLAGGAPALFASRLAIAHIMNQTAILPTITLELISNNTNSVVGTGNILAFDQVLNRGVVAIVGEYNSGVSVAVGYVSTWYQVPMVSYGSTSPDFTTFHSTQYPYFLRMCPSQNLESALLAYIIRELGWTRVGLVYTTDSPGASGAQVFQAIAAQLGIQVVGSASFAYTGALADVYYSMSQLKATGATILLFIGAITDMHSIIQACAWGLNTTAGPPLGMYGAGYQWLGLHSYMYTSLYTGTTGIVQYQYDFAQGMLGLQNFADLDSTVYQNFAASWAATPVQADIAAALTPTDSASITLPGDFAYDAVWFIARAIHAMEGLGYDMSTPGAYSKPAFLAQLKNVTFAGVSGPVSVDSNGDRSAPFDLVNFQGTQILTVGKVVTSGTVTLSSTTPIQFMGGYKALDHVVRGTYVIPESIRSGMTAMTIICLLIVMVGIAVVVVLRDEPIMKAASPPFVILMLVGVMLLVSANFPRINENYTDTVAGCKADLFLTNLGYTLIVGSLLVKTYRLDTIFRMRQFQVRVLTNLRLGSVLAVLLILQTALLLGLIYGDPLYMQVGTYSTTDDYSYCSSDKQSTVYVGAIMAYRFFLLLVTVAYTIRIRNIPDEFAESKQLGMTMYNLVFLSILLPIIDGAMGRGKGTAVIAYGVAIFVIALVSTGIMLLPKLLLYRAMLRSPTRKHGSTASDLTDSSKATSTMPTRPHPTMATSGGRLSAVPMPRTTTPNQQNRNTRNLTHTGATPTATPTMFTRQASSSGALAAAAAGSPALSIIPAVKSSTATSAPNSPRVHVGRGVSAQLLQMIAQQLQAADVHMASSLSTTAPVRPDDSTPTATPMHHSPLGSPV